MDSRTVATTPRAARTALAAALVAGLAAGAAGAAENIDPDDDGSSFAWSENAGWLNAEPLGDGGPGVVVGDFELGGWLWGENVGWISLDCRNTSSCGQVFYRVLNDGAGVLSGKAWSENAGWIEFAPQYGGVSVDPLTGLFSGHAWSENLGWVAFEASPPGTFALRTAWRCVAPPPPAASPVVTVARAAPSPGGDVVVTWTALPDASGYDVVRGDLVSLVTPGGGIGGSVEECVADDQVDRVATEPIGVPRPGTGKWWLVRGVTCASEGTWDGGGPAQSAPRDAALAAGPCS